VKKSEFLTKISTHAKDLPASEFERVCLALARQIPEDSYDETLDAITRCNSDHDDMMEAQIALLDEIKKLCAAVENGEYDFSYDYDPYDDLWDDNERFVDEDDLGGKISDYLGDLIFYIKREQYAIALEGFDLLFSIECSDELGEDVTLLRLLEEDRLRLEAKTIAEYYAYTALMVLRGNDRVHAICKIAQLFPRDLEICEVPYVEGCEIPDLTPFLDDWMSFLMDESTEQLLPERESLLVNAVIAHGGTPGLQEFTQKHGAEFPLAYIELIHAYRDGGQTETAVDVAKDGLAKVQGISRRRTEIADLLAEISQTQQDGESIEQGIIEGFRSSLDLKHFISLYRIGRNDVIDKAFRYLSARAKRDSDFYRMCALYGDHESVWEACRGDEELLGWTYSDKGKLIPLLIALLSSEGKLPQSVERLLRNSFDYYGLNLYSELSDDFVEILVAHKKDLPEEIHRQYSQWSQDHVCGRVNAIVDGQHRGSYGKAALIACAMAEVIKAKEGAAAALQYIQDIKKNTRDILRFNANCAKL
jgi:hypothetical protein